jgi:hypothetical protein
MAVLTAQIRRRPPTSIAPERERERGKGGDPGKADLWSVCMFFYGMLVGGFGSGRVGKRRY